MALRIYFIFCNRNGQIVKIVLNIPPSFLSSDGFLQWSGTRVSQMAKKRSTFTGSKKQEAHTSNTPTHASKEKTK